MSKKKAVWALSVVCVLFGAGLALVRHNLNQRLNRPEFHAALEREISKALEGKISFASVRGNVGVRPWIRLGDIDFSADSGDLHGMAKELRVGVRVLPLLRREVVFSHVALEAPRLRIRRRKDGSEPVFPNFNRTGEEKGDGFKFQIQQMTIEKATLDLVDESRAGFPSVTLHADISINRRAGESGTDVKASGQLMGSGESGNFLLEGGTGKGGDFHFKVSRIPLSVVSGFVPALSPVMGSFSMNGSIGGVAGHREWKIAGHTESLRLAETGQALPVRAEWTAQSGSSVAVQAVWTSTASHVTAEVLLPDMRAPSLFATVKGRRVDLEELMAFYSSFPRASSRPVLDAPPWSVVVRLDVDRFLWRQWTVDDVHGRADAGPTRGRVTDLSFTLSSGTVTGRGDWRRSPRAKKAWALSGSVEVDGIDVSDLAQAVGSPVQWGARFSGKARVTDYPVRPDEPMDFFTLLRSIPLAEMVHSSGSVTLEESGGRFIDEAGFVLAQERKKGGGTIHGFGLHGHSSFTVVAQWPSALENQIPESRSLSVRADIQGMDLQALGTLYPTLGFRRGRAWVSGEWQSGLNLNSARDCLFNPTAQWAFNVRVSSADWKGVDLADVHGRLAWGTDRVFRVSDLGGQAAGGSLSLQSEIRGIAEGGPLTFAINGKVKDIETKEIVAAISTHAYLVKGKFSGAIDLSGPLHPWNPSGLNGRLEFTGTNGEFLTSPTVLSVFSALKINSLLRTLEGKKEPGLPFDVFKSSGPVQSGRYILDEPLLLKNGSFQIAYTGWMDVRLMTARGTVLFNFLQGTSSVIKKIPVLSSLVLGEEGELIPLVVDVVFEKGETSVSPRSIKTLTGPLVSVVKNVFHFPFSFFSTRKKE
jgi:hypothetical protein